MSLKLLPHTSLTLAGLEAVLNHVHQGAVIASCNSLRGKPNFRGSLALEIISCAGDNRVWSPLLQALHCAGNRWFQPPVGVTVPGSAAKSDRRTFTLNLPRNAEEYDTHDPKGKPDVGFALFESAPLKWPGFVEFDDVNGKVLTYFAQDSIYKVFDLRNYRMLYSIFDKNVQEIKISPGIMLFIFAKTIAMSC
ncbi:hypothetical protein PIB30_047910 [Stylosanthes scabra]|uniref:Uncharacterized protein n=1 Tax=Stylosanthes scabra TaxID=79078 RepID=A0ABU6SGT8_9FABA|nr:hypothetical protein [Stylosanthes scabra]